MLGTVCLPATRRSGDAAVLPLRPNASAEPSAPYYSGPRRNGSPTPASLHARRQNAQLRQTRGPRRFSTSHHQHPAAESGGMVQPYYRDECRWSRDLRFHSSRPEDSGAVFLGFAGRGTEARDPSRNLGNPSRRRQRRTAPKGHGVLADSGRTRDPKHNLSDSLEFSPGSRQRKYPLGHGHSRSTRNVRNILFLHRRSHGYT